MSKESLIPIHNATPVLVLGGTENGLSIVRSLGRRGVAVSVAAKDNCFASLSRFCHKNYLIPQDVDAKQFWQDLLLAAGNSELSGSVIFTCNDDAVEFVTENENELKKNYILETQDKVLRAAMLDKQKTLELGRTVGISTPNFWEINTIADIEEIQDKVLFPALVKPLHSHIFQRYFKNKKFLLAKNHSELFSFAKLVLDKQIRFMICEKIPGPDSLLSSFFTYLTPSGDQLFKYTKRVIRRFPINHGGGSYHITDWVPETAELGDKFFKGIKFKGIGNIEFKRDERDGKLKLIEVNARFTAVQELLVRSGLDIAFIIYSYLIGQEVPVNSIPTKKVRLWYPDRDFDAYRELRDAGEISFFQWAKSIAHKQVFPYFKINDPFPSVGKFFKEDAIRLKRLVLKYKNA